jgi:hypothetical protein
VAPILAQVRGDAVAAAAATISAARTGSGWSPPRALRIVATWSMLTPRRRRKRWGSSLQAWARLPGLIAGVAASSGGTSSGA